MITYVPLPAARLRFYSRLNDKKFRKQNGKFLIEGLRAVSQAIENRNIEFEAIICISGVKPEPRISSLIPADCQLYETDAGTFAKISDTENSQGIAAIAEIPSPLVPDLIKPDDFPFILALDAIQDPGNLGTIYRTAVWFGVDLLLIGNNTVDLFNPKVIRSTAGSIGAIPYVTGALEEIIPQIQSKGWNSFALDISEKANSLFELDLKKPLLFTIGNEAHGVSPELKTLLKPVFLPGNRDKVESLNASVAAGTAIAYIIQSTHNAD